MVYIFKDVNFFTDDDFVTYTPLLSDDRIKKRDKYIFKADRVTSMLAYLLLEYALFIELGNAEIPVFGIGKGGKPYIDCGISFNLSHCRCAVMCGISKSEIGVDIQERKPMKYDISEMVLSEAEILELESSKRERCFADFWTLKEAYGKAISCGIGYDLKSVSFDNISNEWTSRFGYRFFCGKLDNCSYSVCSSEDMEIRIVEYEDLKNILRQIIYI